MAKRAKQDITAAAAAFEAYFPTVARDLKRISRRFGAEFTSRYGHDLASIIKELLRKPRRARGRPPRKIRLYGGHSQLAVAIHMMSLDHQKAGASDPLAAAIAEATRLEAEEGHPKSVDTVRKYYWQGRRALGPKFEQILAEAGYLPARSKEI